MSTPEQPTPPSGQPDPYGTPQQPSNSGPQQQPPQAPPYGAPQQQPPQAPTYGAPQAPQYGESGYGAPVPENPGKTLGVVGLVLSFLPCLAIVGLILSIVGLSKSRKAGQSNGVAVAGIIIGAIVVIVSIIGAILFGIGLTHIAEVCKDLGPGTHVRDGVTYTCP